MRCLRRGFIRAGILSMVAGGMASTMSAQIWGPLEKDGCRSSELRQLSAQLFNLPADANWKTACYQKTRNVMGNSSRSPDRCRQKRLFRIITLETRGEWDVADPSCLADPPSVPERGGIGSLASAELLEGFADIHVHQMAHLGFGGSIVWGGAFGDPQKYLGAIPSKYKRGHDTTETAVTGHYPKTFMNTFIADLFGHGEDGWPTFKSWPNHDIWTHQQVYQDWLFREYQGGLRLMVLLAVNSEDMFGRGENHLPFIIRRHRFQRFKEPGRTGNDMEALEWQVRAAYDMQRAIDEKYGGPGNGWYRIVRDPQEASEVVAQGRLAVILGTELQHLFNCDIDRPACTTETISDGLNRLEAMGVNYVFPIHHKLNQFGGPATFQPLNSGPTENCLDLAYECSSIGLTGLGRVLLKELAARGMLIDTEHMSRKAFDDAMSIVESLHYPVLAGHVVPLDLQTRNQNERGRTSDELSRIFKVGGMVAPILGTSADEYDPGKTMSPPIPVRCSSNDGGADQWANAYMLIRDLAKDSNGNEQLPIPLGTDWNGFAGWPGPRHDNSHPCHSRYTRNHVRIPLEHSVTYPFLLPPELKPAAIGSTSNLDQFVWPDTSRQWDYNLVGAAHAGMVPDFIENLRLLGLTVADLEPLYRSARGVVDLWKNARVIGASDGQHHLRWAPQSPFDVLPFEQYWDESRNVEGQKGYALCRTREGHKLGFVRNNDCQSVEEMNSPVEPEDKPMPISSYDAGRCLNIKNASFEEGADVEQKTCDSGTSQLWQVRSLSSDEVAISNVNSDKCLAIAKGTTSKGARAVQQNCGGRTNQTWNLKRVGNTFQMMPSQSILCLEVANQSRKDGARIRLADCSGASNQLWNIDSRRTADFERLYQADKNRYTWQGMPTVDFPVITGVDGSRWICRSRDAELWIGVVKGKLCVGKNYAGAPASTSVFDELYQAR
jgi:microsomal dipeptidase-like Zn-dependent dipeptidase